VSVEKSSKKSGDSIFAVLMRSPWWASAGIATVIAVIAWAVSPPKYGIYASMASLPFWVVAAMAAFRQMRLPSESHVQGKMQAIRALSWKDFSAGIEQALQKDGFVVSRLDEEGADYLLSGTVHTGVVACKRWKAANVGIDQLRELVKAMEKHEANECVYVTSGTFTQAALEFAVENKIRLLHGAVLVAFLRDMKLKAPAVDTKR
jgi:restriction system protein